MRAERVHGIRRFVPCGAAKGRRGKDHSVVSVLHLSSAISHSNSLRAMQRTTDGTGNEE